MKSNKIGGGGNMRSKQWEGKAAGAPLCGWVAREESEKIKMVEVEYKKITKPNTELEREHKRLRPDVDIERERGKFYLQPIRKWSHR